MLTATYAIARWTVNPARASRGQARRAITFTPAITSQGSALRWRPLSRGSVCGSCSWFRAPQPTDGRRRTSDERVRLITDEMRESSREHGCRFHRAWYAQDGSAFYAVARWESREGARAFFEQWEIDAEPGEIAVVPEGDVLG